MGDDPRALPAGTITFVLGDVVGSTRLWEKQAGEIPLVLARLEQIIDEGLGSHRGARPAEQGEGDNFVAVFARGDDAASFALHVARAVAGERRQDEPRTRREPPRRPSSRRRRSGGSGNNGEIHARPRASAGGGREAAPPRGGELRHGGAP